MVEKEFGNFDQPANVVVIIGDMEVDALYVVVAIVILLMVGTRDDDNESVVLVVTKVINGVVVEVVTDKGASI